MQIKALEDDILVGAREWVSLRSQGVALIARHHRKVRFRVVLGAVGGTSMGLLCRVPKGSL